MFMMGRSKQKGIHIRKMKLLGLLSNKIPALFRPALQRFRSWNETVRSAGSHDGFHLFPSQWQPSSYQLILQVKQKF
jgi:hypothetical protein